MKYLAIFTGVAGGMALGFFTGHEAVYYRGWGIAMALAIIWMGISAGGVTLSFPGPRRWYVDRLVKPVYDGAIWLFRFMERLVRRLVEWSLVRIPATSIAGKLLQLLLRLITWITEFEVRLLQRSYDYFTTEYYTTRVFMVVVLRVVIMSVGPAFLIGVLS